MYDMRHLEREWKQYRKKKLKPWYIGSFLFFSALLTLLFFLYRSNMNLNVLSTYFTSIKNITIEKDNDEDIQVLKNPIVLNGPLMHLEVEPKRIDDVEQSEETLPNLLVDIPILDGVESEAVNTTGKVRKKIHLDIIETTNITAYKDVERRFKHTHDTDDSLFLARSYYKHKQYKKSEYWALETNKVDSNIEESMLIFVKSKMKLGNKNEARNILKRYIKKTNASEAKKLLYRIENGKF
ncbi:MAG: hypothetical protein U9O64_05110 [Campylobacterota bacterium]|nr:hypothetical protein [Campylobacterota bacterium]